MTLSKAIERADNLRPNPFEEEQKAVWLSELDGKIFREVLKKKDFSGYDFAEDAEKELLLPDEYADIYLFYLSAMIDFFSRDYAEYNNSMEMFNSSFSGFLAAYNRENMGLLSGGESSGGYYKNIF